MYVIYIYNIKTENGHKLDKNPKNIFGIVMDIRLVRE